MVSIILQYVLIAFLVVGIGYLVYLLKDKDVSIKDDYFGVAYILLDTLSNDEATPENAKNILRAISTAVNYVESNYKDEDNEIKEEKALKMAKEAINALNLQSSISDDSIRYVIRLAAALLPSKKSLE
ncbi:hypothetical protein [Clostridium rectalis]|uniref:hypothetical protein n=1 Tax=Clostridium rectalis TaxID=2040295 RepID=UPI000F635A8D|nr:hypothetical protein [Clostridium rectalis]